MEQNLLKQKYGGTSAPFLNNPVRFSKTDYIYIYIYCQTVTRLKMEKKHNLTLNQIIVYDIGRGEERKKEKRRGGIIVDTINIFSLSTDTER